VFLVAWVFMHLRESTGLVRLFAIAALFWLGAHGAQPRRLAHPCVRDPARDQLDGSFKKLRGKVRMLKSMS
jgi:hypothetical protein